MSVDCLMPPRSVHKRQHETRTSASLLNSKCGEILVTADWNKWTYNCTFCQLTTSDIGVFICHIRLQHSYFESKINEINKNNSTTTQPTSNIGDDAIDLESDTESCSSVQDTIIKEDEMIHPIEIMTHNVKSEEDQELLDQQHNSLEMSTEDTEIMDNSNPICSKVKQIFNLDTLVVSNYERRAKKRGRERSGSVNKAQKRNKEHDKNQSFITSLQLNANYVKEQLKLGKYKVKTLPGRSKIWELFGTVIDSNGETLPNVVACSKCLSICKHDRRSTSNLLRHSCLRK